MKTCRGCNHPFKPRDKQINYCLECAPTQQDRMLMKMYGINMMRCQELLRQQDFKCVLCLRPFAEIKVSPRKCRSWVIDHCHVHKKVRGLLCQTCNQLLGYYEALGAKEWSDRALEYLKRGTS